MYTIAANNAGAGDVPAYYSAAVNTGAGAGDDSAYYSAAVNTGSVGDGSSSVYVSLLCLWAMLACGLAVFCEGSLVSSIEHATLSIARMC